MQPHLGWVRADSVGESAVRAREVGRQQGHVWLSLGVEAPGSRGPCAAPQQQQRVGRDVGAEGEGLTRPPAHAQRSWGVPATSVMTAVSQTWPVKTVFPNTLMSPPSLIMLDGGVL